MIGDLLINHSEFENQTKHFFRTTHSTIHMRNSLKETIVGYQFPRFSSHITKHFSFFLFSWQIEKGFHNLSGCYRNQMLYQIIHPNVNESRFLSKKKKKTSTTNF